MIVVLEMAERFNGEFGVDMDSGTPSILAPFSDIPSMLLTEKDETILFLKVSADRLELDGEFVDERSSS